MELIINMSRKNFRTRNDLRSNNKPNTDKSKKYKTNKNLSVQQQKTLVT